MHRIGVVHFIISESTQPTELLGMGAIPRKLFIFITVLIKGIEAIWSFISLFIYSTHGHTPMQ